MWQGIHTLAYEYENIYSCNNGSDGQGVVSILVIYQWRMFIGERLVEAISSNIMIVTL